MMRLNFVACIIGGSAFFAFISTTDLRAAAAIKGAVSWCWFADPALGSQALSVFA